jgi:hypothetical protein
LSNFWKFNPCDKHDQIKEGRHDELFLAALADPETGIEKINRDTYILYGEEEALYMQPTTFIYRLGLDLIEAFLRLKQ